MALPILKRDSPSKPMPWEGGNASRLSTLSRGRRAASGLVLPGLEGRRGHRRLLVGCSDAADEAARGRDHGYRGGEHGKRRRGGTRLTHSTTPARRRSRPLSLEDTGCASLPREKEGATTFGGVL